MTIIRKIYRRALMELSKVIFPPHLRKLKHLHVQGFQLLALCNEDVGRYLMLFGQYEYDEVQFLRTYINETSTCFDVGGNIGFFSMFFAQLASRGNVHVFEPIPLNAALIKTNLILNGFKNIHLNECAVGEKKDQVRFSVSKDSAYSAIKDTGRKQEAESIQVPIISLEEYVQEHEIKQIDVMKVDVEGAEELVIDGAKDLLFNPKLRPKVILMELYEKNLVIFGSSISNILTKMERFGYHPYVIEAGGSGLIAYDQSVHSRFYNVIFKPSFES